MKEWLTVNGNTELATFVSPDGILFIGVFEEPTTDNERVMYDKVMVDKYEILGLTEDELAKVRGEITYVVI